MNVKKAALPWIAGTTVLIIIVIFAGWAFFVSPNLDERDEVAAQADVIDSDNLVLEQRVESLRLDFLKIEDYREDIQELRIHVPSTDEIKVYNQIISDQIIESGGGLVRVGYNTPTLLTLATPPTIAEEVPEPESSTGGESESTTEDDATPETPVNNTPADAPANLTVVPVEIQVIAPYASLVRFLQLQQSNERIFLIGAIALTVADEAETEHGKIGAALGDVEVTISGYLFALPTLESEAAAQESVDPNAPLAPLPVPADPTNPFVPIEGGSPGSANGNYVGGVESQQEESGE